MKRVRPLVVTSLLAASLLFGVGATAHAQDMYHVVTIYFAGTGATMDFWSGEAGADFYPCDIIGWPGCIRMKDWFGKPELLATLHRNQIAVNTQAGGNGFSAAQSTFTVPGSNIILKHHKYFINGVGTGPWGTRVWDRQNPARADANMGWSKIILLAEAYLKKIIGDAPPPAPIILNLVGWSRGCISALWFGNYVARDAETTPVIDIDIFKDRVKKINIMVFDPVSGITDSGQADPWPGYFEFDDLSAINEVVLIYAWDERSGHFIPTMPLPSNLGQQRLFFGVPGSHETMVGNTWNDGHTLRKINQWKPEWGDWQRWPTISAMSDLTAVIAAELMESPEWGAARFSNNSWQRPSSLAGTCWDYWGVFGDIVNPNLSFEALFDSRYASSLEYPQTSYDRMRYLGYVPAGWPTWGWLDRPDLARSVWQPLYPPYSYSLWSRKDWALWAYAPYYGTWVKNSLSAMRGQPPVANAGPDQIVHTTTVTLDGSGTYDPDHGSPRGDQPWTYYDWRSMSTGAFLAEGYGLKRPVV